MENCAVTRVLRNELPFIDHPALDSVDQFNQGKKKRGVNTGRYHIENKNSYNGQLIEQAKTC